MGIITIQPSLFYETYHALKDMQNALEFIQYNRKCGCPEAPGSCDECADYRRWCNYPDIQDMLTRVGSIISEIESIKELNKILKERSKQDDK